MFAVITTLVVLMMPQDAPPEPPPPTPPEESVETVKAENQRLATLVEEMEKKLAALEEENHRLLSGMNGLDQKMVEMAREIVRLQKIVREELRATPSAKADPGSQPSPAKTPANTTPVVPAAGPGKAVVGEIMSNNLETGVVLLRPGQNGGIATGMKFEVVRDGKRVGMLMIEKAEARIARASVIEGDRKQIKTYDRIVEMVDPEATPAMPKKPADGDPLGDKAVATSMIISGKIGDDYLITGDTGKLQVGSKVYVYRDKTLKGILTIMRLDRDGATARMTSGSDASGIDTNDVVVLKERKMGITGVVKLVTAQAVALDIGTDNGVAKGQVYVVERLGNVVGEIQITIVESYYAFAEPMVGSELSTFRKGDAIRLKN